MKLHFEEDQTNGISAKAKTIKRKLEKTTFYLQETLKSQRENLQVRSHFQIFIAEMVSSNAESLLVDFERLGEAT